MSKRLLQLLAKNRQASKRGTHPLLAQSGEDEVTLYLYDMIVASAIEAEYWGGVAAESFVPQIRAVQAKTIHLRINSPGGDVFAAQAIAQALRDSKAQVIAHVDGMALSAATVVATAAAEIEMAIGALYMVHRAWTIAIGNTNELMEHAALLEKVDGTLAVQYAQRTGAGLDDMLAVMDAETWMTAQEAVEAKFVDRVAEEAPQVDAAWDLSAYAKAPPAREESMAALLQSAEHRQRQGQRIAYLERAAPRQDR